MPILPDICEGISMFFDDLTQEEVNMLEKSGTVKVYDVGSYLMREGSKGTSLSIILSGSVEVRKPLTDFHSKAVAVLKACDLVGDLGFLGAESRSADIIALSICETLEFEKSTFESIIDMHPKLGAKIYRNIARILAQRLVNTNDELRDAVIWSLEKGIERLSLPDIRQEYKLKFKKP